MAELVGLVSGERLACFPESCGPLPYLGAAAPRVASGPALRDHRPSDSVAAGDSAPLGWLGGVWCAVGRLWRVLAKSGLGASNRHLPRDKGTSRLHALTMRWVLMLFGMLAAVMGGEARAVVVMGRVVVSKWGVGVEGGLSDYLKRHRSS